MEDLAKKQKQIYRSITPTDNETVAVRDALGRMPAEEKTPWNEELDYRPLAGIYTAEALAAKLMAGVTEVEVKRRPRVGVVYENLDQETLGNALALLIAEAGGEARLLKTGNPGQTFLKEIDNFDGMLILGGAKAEFISTLEERDAKIFFKELNTNPGENLLGAVSVKKPILVLPDNSYHAIVCFQGFFLQSLKNMLSGKKQAASFLSGELKAEITNDEGKNLLIPVDLTLNTGVLQAWPVEQNLEGLAKAKGLVTVREEEKVLDGFSVVQIMPLPGFDSIFV